MEDCYISRNTVSLDWKRQEMRQREGRVTQREEPQIQRPKKVGLKRVGLPPGPRVKPGVTDYSQGFKPNETCPAGLKTCLGFLIPLLLPISPIWNGDIYPMLVPPLYFWR